MTNPLREAENCTTHPLYKAQNLMTHPFPPPRHPYFLTSHPEVNVCYLYQIGELEGGRKSATDSVWSFIVFDIKSTVTKLKVSITLATVTVSEARP